MLLTKLMTDGIYINNAMFTFIWRIAFVDKLSTGQCLIVKSADIV